MPLAWAHAEYVKLVRSAELGSPVDRVTEVEARYIASRPPPPPEIWTFDRKNRTVRVRAGGVFRVVHTIPFRLRYSLNQWAQTVEMPSIEISALGISYCDILLPKGMTGDVVFTFYWPEAMIATWEPRDYRVEITR